MAILNRHNVRALELVKSGEIGHVFHARIHMAHQGPKEAGCSPYFYNWLYDAKQNGAGPTQLSRRGLSLGAAHRGRRPMRRRARP